MLLPTPSPSLGSLNTVSAEDFRLYPSLSDWSSHLDPLDKQILDRYTKFFSTTYPTCKDASNPFLKVLIPLAMRHRTVLDAMLALSCVQSWENGQFTMRATMLRYRAKAIRGCSDLVKKVMSNPEAREDAFSQGQNTLIPVITPRTTEIVENDDIIPLLATSVLLMLYEKLHGEGKENGTSHLQLFAQLFPSQLFSNILDRLTQTSKTGYQTDAMLFLSNSFLYNDLVRSTSLRTTTLSTFYYERPSSPTISHRFYFPTIIARIGANDMLVSDADIIAWDGTLSWLPSLALQFSGQSEQTDLRLLLDSSLIYGPTFQKLEAFVCINTWSEEKLISELYRVAALVYRRQQQPDKSSSAMGSLPGWAMEILRLIPPSSPYGTALLWPIALVGPALTDLEHREYVFSRLQMLERQCKIKTYANIAEHLVNQWGCHDNGSHYKSQLAYLFG
ncbi:hypothetical protein CPAR01_07115 [Colletotrichum paranaense]|uniref:Fungal-specific transcription factor domain-containing protein n=1 Tax=Colletotrichum paranaense TaxID=1914294 RepID=A0ABQ9SNN4_9PEZI|nr:uncharacterized protein CPAR01_07115 [Colletotrichum paranaense]KAK1541126.1 hypothetical protein CPAR01_07115 [Colletotrichum paranaense]